MKKILFSVNEYTAAYIIGAVVYTLIEVFWRGFSHWTMFFTGGFCFALIYHSNIVLKKTRLAVKCLVGTVFITLTEFFVGCAVNLVLEWSVWDYSGMPLNVLGQICLIYCVLWFILCIPAYILSSHIQRHFIRLKSIILRTTESPDKAMEKAV